MIEQDTVKLLRECDAGIKMGITAVDETLDYVKNNELKNCLVEGKAKHEELKEEMQTLLDKYHDDGKEPSAMGKSMAWVKTNVKLATGDPDKAVADLITDGCNTGVKSLNRYLNQYEAADEKSKDITKRLIDLEQNMAVEVRSFL